MGLTRSFRETVEKKVRQDARFRAALIEEAAQNIIDGDVETAIAQLRDIINATVGFDRLAAGTGIGKTSLMRMLSASGNPAANNLGAIMKVVGRDTGVRIKVHVEPEQA